MPKLFSWIDRRYWVYQPNFTRQRHRFRGVRESLKVNQEVSQYYYDLKRVESINDTTYENLESYEDVLTEGGTVEGVQYNWVDSPDGGDLDLVLDGIQDISSRMEILRKRIRFLENTEGSVDSTHIKDFLTWYTFLWADDYFWDISEYYPGDGGNVEVMIDSIFDGHSAIQSTPSKCPILTEEDPLYNGHNTVNFDGLDDLLYTYSPIPDLPQPYTIVAVGSIAAVSQELCDGLPLSGSNRARIYRTAANKWGIAGGSAVESTVAADSNPHLFTAVYNGASSELLVDGTQVLSGNVGTHSLTGFTLGANILGLANNGGAIAFYALYSGDITADENWSTFKTWIAGYYGLTVA